MDTCRLTGAEVAAGNTARCAHVRAVLGSRNAGQSSPAFLSVRLPQATRDRLKATAVARGQTVQGLVDSLVERFLAEETRQAPDLQGNRVKDLRGDDPGEKVIVPGRDLAA